MATFAASLGVLASLANALYLAHEQSSVRLRELAPLWFVRRVAEKAGVNLMAFLPRIVSRSFEAQSNADIFTFLLLAAATGLLCAGVVLALAFPLAWVLARRGRDRSTTSRSGPDRPSSIANRLSAHAVSRRVGNAVRFLGLGASLVVLAGALLFGVGASAQRAERLPATAATRDRPNILLISIDSLRRDHLGCYGYGEETSPRLDALAREGTRFETVVAPTTWTLPSHLTLLTSLPPERHGVVLPEQRLRPEVVSLAQLLWQAGYATAGFVSAPFLDAGYGFGRGFDLYDDYTVARATNPDAHNAITSPGLHAITTRWLTRWSERGRERPFFIFLHMWDPHLEYEPPPPYDTMFTPDVAGARRVLEGKGSTRSPEELARLIARYDGEIRFTDEYIGKLCDELRALGVYDQTIIAVTADHGDEFYEHGNEGHRHNLYDETLLVPLLLRYPPCAPAGRVIASQVRLMDIAPTLLALTGISPPSTFGFSSEGLIEAAQSLTPFFTNPASDSQAPLTAFADLNGEQVAVRTQTDKLHAWVASPRGQEGAPDDPGAVAAIAVRQEGREVYDLLRDPGERRNILGADAARDAARIAALEAWRRTMISGTKAAGQIALGEERRALLRSLGYIK